MEAGARTAGNGDEQCREQRAARVGPAGEGRDFELRFAGEGAADDAEDSQDHHRIEQIAGQVVTGLEQDPDRNKGGHRNVDADEDDPCGTAHRKADVEAQDDDQDDHSDAHSRRGLGVHAVTVGHQTEADRQDDEQDGNHGGCLVAGRVCDKAALAGIRQRHERTCDDVDEGRQDQDQHQQCEDDEQALCTLAHGGLDDLADGFAAVADRSEQRTEVLQAAEKDTTDDTPEEDRDPAEYRSQDRTVDRAGTGDGREVVPHEDVRLGRDVVNAVLHGLGRRRSRGIHAPLLRQPAAVSQIPDEQDRDRSHDDK